ncbi:MAG: apolipoprotein N-acyltransferase [Gemmatimonadetes bacterium]|nr:apolipoprotein N-acyltransferase [Gemmatimonadota bacterium]
MSNPRFVLVLTPLYRLLLAALSGALLSLAFPCHPDHPLAFLYQPLWAHCALVPLLIALKGRGFKAGFAAGWISGLVWNLLSLYWVAYTQGGGPAVVGGTGLMAAYLGLFIGLCTGLFNVLAARWGAKALALLPLLWTGQEYLLSLGELGFPWLLLGHSQAALPYFIQYATWTGVFGVSCWVVGLNALFYSALVGRRIFLAGVALGYLLPWIHAQSAMAIAVPTEGLRIGLIQPNTTYADKWGPNGLERTFSALATLSRQAAKRDPELLVWPETAVPCDPVRRAGCRGRIQALVEELDIPLLTGAPHANYNAAFFVQPGATTLPSYAKMHLVPFGERTPYRDAIPLLRDIDWTRLTGDLGPAEFARGTEHAVFAHPRHPFAVLICFESIFPDLVRQHVAAGARVLVNITNDSWFGRSAGPYQHALINAMRAVENRTAIARSATTGISLFIDPFGRTYEATDLFTPAVAVATVPVGQPATFYTRHGDLFAWSCLLVVLVAFIARFRKPQPAREPAAADHEPETHHDIEADHDPDADHDSEAPHDSDSPREANMPFLDHLEELRWRILKALAALVVGAVICFAFSDSIMQILTRPYEEAVLSLESQQSSGVVLAVKKLVSQWLDQPDAAPEPDAPIADLPPARRLQALRPMTYFFISLQIAFVGGLLLALPVIFYQAWRFVAPGLLQREKRLTLPIISLSVLCFSIGALIAYYIVLPLGLRFFLALEPPDMTSQWAADEYIGFVLRLIAGFGIVFEMPVLSLFLAKVGVLTAARMRRIRRYAIIGIFVLGAIFTPPDPVSQLLMALPLLLLYEISIWVCKISERK